MSVFDLAYLLPMAFAGASVGLLIVALSTFWHGPSRDRYEQRQDARRAQRLARAREDRLRQAMGLEPGEHRPTRRERSRRGWF